MKQTVHPTVVLGGGFTGLFTALHLCHQRYSQPIVLIDQKERFIFKPLLYEFLSGEMSTDQVWPRFGELLNCEGVTFVQDTIQTIDLSQRQVKLTSGLRYTYGNLVLALGSTVGYFGVEGAKENSFPFRTGDDAMALGEHLRRCLQQASQLQDPLQRRRLLTVAVVGAGPAGVEMAATLADLLPLWYSKLGGLPQEIQVVLLNRSKDILKGDVNSQLRDTALASLQRRTVPVELRSEVAVSAIRPEQVEYQRNGQLEILPAATTIWTAGNATHPLLKELAISKAHRNTSGRVRVMPTLQIPEFPEVFAGGDCIAQEDFSLPLTAQVAYQQGAAIARNLKAFSTGNDLQPSVVHLRGTLMKLGLGESVANLFDRVEIRGRLGHLIRQGTYLELLPNSVHNFKATTEWLTDEIFQHHSNSGTKNQKPSQVLRWAGGAVAAGVLMSSSLLVWRAIQPAQFRQVWQPTGLPALVDQVLPVQK
ncbi:NAD(P)/FAD-dependent oxidoreductase [Leptolyngbya sp. FACHB-261]|uniref:NAD(P)/FAD-dependent oxidoreductase n=1 Tax=Leptolyngbya sp. FACHB-261 TaxID=2692806 RepID=UPI00168268BE|nr:NAD(P)/FAD-dependent oxidoreductase [Leptolyngbya sp. FACHB-261]MBD2100443.1 NAD(P)/FAD-dependent oxidoreductase [Leptolyngbya sp. FACHB-261]